jgi:hypothetical protein
MFTGYYNDLHENITKTWWITPEVVTQYQGITNFKVTRYKVWIQERKDPENEWLQLRYYVKEEDIEMTIKDWHDDWRIPAMNQEMSMEKEDDVGQE